MASIRERDLLGNKPKSSIAEYLREIGDEEAAVRMAARGGSGQGFGSRWGVDVWGYTGVLIGYIGLNASGTAVPVRNAMTLPPDPTLKNTRIKLTLDRFWVHRYPGLGTHTILCEFRGKNQIQGEAEELRFTLTTEARDRSSAAISGSPIFLGVSVGANGIAFEGSTVNVRSDRDEILLKALGSGPFRDGLSLLTTAQPALKPFASLASSLVSSVLSRSKNRPIYSFKLGLDFEESNTSASLCYGSFIVVQGDQSQWSWDSLVWNADSQQLLRKHDGTQLEYNYLVFRVAPYHGP